MSPPRVRLRSTCRAAVFHAPGQPLEIREFPRPVLGPGQALVRVSLATICGSDLHTVQGHRETPTPTVLGHEAVGVIEEVSAQAPPDGNARVGDRVVWGIAASCGACYYCASGLPQKCASGRKYGHLRLSEEHALSGCLATHVHLLCGSWLARVPETLPDRLAAPAACAVATTGAAMRAGGLIRGRTLVVSGLGMLGLIACAMGHGAGASEVIGVDPASARRGLAGAFGASAAVAPEEAGEAILAATSGRGADVALEMSGSPEGVARALSLLRLGGTCVLVGSTHPQPPLALTSEDIVRRCLTIRGQHNYRPLDLVNAVAFLDREQGRYPFGELVSGAFALEDVNSAFALAASGTACRVAVEP